MPKTHHQNNPTWKGKKTKKKKKPVESSKPAQSYSTEEPSNIHRDIAFHDMKTGTSSGLKAWTEFEYEETWGK